MPEPIPTELLNCRITAPSYTDELLPDDEPSSFATHLPFEVRQGDLVVARVHALLLRVRLAEKNGVSPAELFDSVTRTCTNSTARSSTRRPRTSAGISPRRVTSATFSTSRA